MSNETIKSHLTANDNIFELTRLTPPLFIFGGKLNPYVRYNHPTKPRIWFVQVPNAIASNTTSVNKANFRAFNRCNHVKEYQGKLLINTFCRHAKTIAQFDYLHTDACLDPLNAALIDKQVIAAYLLSNDYNDLTKTIDVWLGLDISDSYINWKSKSNLFNFLSGLTTSPLVSTAFTGVAKLDYTLVTKVLNNISLETLAPFMASITIGSPRGICAPMLLKPALNKNDPNDFEITYRLAFLVLQHGIKLSIGKDKLGVDSLVPLPTQLLFHKNQQALFPSFPQHLLAY